MKFICDKIQRTIEHLKSAEQYERENLSGFLYKVCDYEPLGVMPDINDGFVTFRENDRIILEKDDHFWLYKKITVKEDNTHLFVEIGGAVWNGNPQFLVYVDGKLVHQLDRNHTDIKFEKAGEYEVYLYGYVGYTSLVGAKYDFAAYLCKIHENVKKLAYHMEVPASICGYLDESDKEYIDLLNILNNTANLIDLRVEGSRDFLESVDDACSFIEEKLYSNTDSTRESVICIGHTHIDVAWLWTVRQSREKMVRSMSMVVNLMRKYPEYKFMTSQPVLLTFVKEDAPELYSEIKALVKEGRFEVEGAMWVEADTNLPSGESLVRQILYGKKFFKDEFDKDCEILWLPDVFGYSAALPQILTKSGINTFVTSKLGWNENNTIPNDAFIWQGIDGTEIFTYFLTAQERKRGEKPKRETGYAAIANPETVSGTWERFLNKELTDEVLMPFGYADGGGGPTEPMLENLRRMQHGIKGCPRTEFDTAGNFLKRMREKTLESPLAKKWVGELYLEFHRGTYTSVGKNKRNNRKSEYMMHNSELVDAIGNVLYGKKINKAEYDRLWKLVLLNQFHDIIPGSSIKEVYDVSDAEYSDIRKSTSSMIEDGLGGISDRVRTNGGLMVFNPNPYEYSGMAYHNGRYVYVKDVPSLGYTVCGQSESLGDSVTVTDKCIENALIRVEFNDDMSIKSIFDKEAQREIVREGESANVIEVYEDVPRAYDTWELSSYYKEKKWIANDVQSVETVDLGGGKGFKIKRNFLNSHIEQTILLYGGSKRIDFDTRVDWHELQLLMKAAFPTTVFANEVKCDIQFGNVTRPTHRNTSWDAAKFEICAHKYIDISENGYGVSLMNDCKYGHDVLGGDMRITLLKCGDNPWVGADTGVSEFKYSLYPHNGGFSECDIEREAYFVNNPVCVKPIEKQTGDLPESYSFAKVTDGNAVLECVKKSEDGKGIIMRFYENFGGRSHVKVQLGFDACRAVLTDLLENETSEAALRQNVLEFDIKPYEILTYKIYTVEGK